MANGDNLEVAMSKKADKTEVQSLQAAVGSPLTAITASAMIDTNKIYVYVGSETGYTNGNWYYWNGSAWTSGGVYNAVAINMDSTPTQGSNNPVSSGGVYNALHDTDTTLTQSGQAADAKAVGDKIDDLIDDLSETLEAEDEKVRTNLGILHSGIFNDAIRHFLEIVLRKSIYTEDITTIIDYLVGAINGVDGVSKNGDTLIIRYSINDPSQQNDVLSFEKERILYV